MHKDEAEFCLNYDYYMPTMSDEDMDLLIENKECLAASGVTYTIYEDIWFNNGNSKTKMYIHRRDNIDEIAKNVLMEVKIKKVHS